MDSAEEAARLLLEAEAAHVRVHVRTAGGLPPLQAAREAQAFFKEARDSRQGARAAMVIIGQLSRAPGGSPAALEVVNDELLTSQSTGDRIGEHIIKLAWAELLMESRDPEKRDDAAEMAKDAKTFFVDSGDRGMEGKATDLIASLLIKKCDGGAGPKAAREAAKYARELQAIAQELGDRPAEARANYLLFSAKMYSEASFKEGLKYAREAASIFEEVGAKFWHATVLCVVADWARMKGHGKDGLPYALQSLAIYKEAETDNASAWEVRAMGALMASYLSGPDGLPSALEVARVGAQDLKAIGTKEADAQALTLQSVANALSGDEREAVKAMEEALAIYRSLGDRQMEVQVLHQLADVHWKAGGVSEALSARSDAARVAAEIGERSSQVRHRTRVVELHLVNEDYEKAAAAASELITEMQNAEDWEGEGVMLLNLALAHLALDATARAVVEAEEARRIFQGLEAKEREADALRLLTVIHARSGKHERALQSATLARGLYQKSGNPFMEANMLHGMAVCGLFIADKASHTEQKDELRRVKRVCQAALKAAKEAIGVTKKGHDKEAFSSIIVSLHLTVAQAQGMLGKREEAMKTLAEARRICAEQGDRHGDCATTIVRAQVLLWEGDLSEAKAAAVQAVNMARSLKDDELEGAAVHILQQAEGPEAAGPSFQRPAPAAGERAAATTLAADDAGIAPYAGPTFKDVLPKVTELALGLLAADELDQDSPLMDSGLDSLSMVQFRNTLQQHFPGVPMPASMVFDHPSVRAVAENIAEELKATHEAGRRRP